MAHTEGKILKFLKSLIGGVEDVPAVYQACESCRETSCNQERAATCKDRALGEAQETRRRLPVVQPYVVSTKPFSKWTNKEFKAAAARCGQSDWKAFKAQCFNSEESLPLA